MARAIAIEGTVDAVTSPEELGRSMHAAAESHSVAPARAEIAMRRHQYKSQRSGVQKDQRQPLSFSAGYPEAVTRGDWHSMLIFAHSPGVAEEVAGRLCEAISKGGDQPRVSIADARKLLARGTRLRFEPHASGLTFEPAKRELVWNRDVEKADFRFRAEPGAAAGHARGEIDVWSGVALVAQIPFSLEILGDLAGTEPPYPKTVCAETFPNVFASYSRTDTRVVDACAIAYSALGIRMVTDRRDLRSGEPWERKLQGLIDEADLFQLFWSWPSS